MKRHQGGTLPPPVVGWIHNYAVHNYWRVAAFYEFDDLCQDGLMCAVKCRHRYGSDLDPPHFAALVRTSFTRHLIDLVEKHRRYPDGIEPFVPEKHGGVEASLGELARQMNELPENLYRALKNLVADPGGFAAERNFEPDLRGCLYDC